MNHRGEPPLEFGGSCSDGNGKYGWSVFEPDRCNSEGITKSELCMRWGEDE